eukprot:352158-Chlamydomonas_euryale.AAC.6
MDRHPFQIRPFLLNSFLHPFQKKQNNDSVVRTGVPAHHCCDAPEKVWARLSAQPLLQPLHLRPWIPCARLGDAQSNSVETVLGGWYRAIGAAGAKHGPPAKHVIGITRGCGNQPAACSRNSPTVAGP